MEIRFEVTQNNLVDMFCLHIQSHGSEGPRGTYNKADPTHYEKWSATFGIEYGYTSIPVPVEQGGGEGIEYPEPENVKVLLHDVTWGVDIEIHTSVGIEKAYWSRPILGSKGEWFRVTPNFFNRMRDIWFNGKEPDWWVAEEQLAAMGYYSCQ